MDGDAMPGPGIAGPANSVQTFNEVDRFRVGHIERHPSHLIGIRRQLVPVGRQSRRVAIERRERPVNDRRPNAIEPSSGVLGAWGRERCAGQLFGVQTVGAFLR